MNRWRQKKKNQGFCVCCGVRKAREGQTICNYCSERTKLIAIERKQYRILNNICITCGKNEPLNGKTRCQKCIDKNAKRIRERRLRLSMEQLCRDCGINKPEKNNSLCSSCLMKNSVTNSIRYHKKMKQWEKLGLCKKCGKQKPKDEYKWCENCRSKQRVDNLKIESIIEKRLRIRIINAIKSAPKKIIKHSKTIELIGCDLKTVMDHIASQFTSGMCWSNHGEWHIDHIRPCASFDLTDPKQQKKCFHWTNLQPLWAKDNLYKHTKEGTL